MSPVYLRSNEQSVAMGYVVREQVHVMWDDVAVAVDDVIGSPTRYRVSREFTG